jgi:hypothetical protein
MRSERWGGMRFYTAFNAIFEPGTFFWNIATLFQAAIQSLFAS